MFSQIRRCNTQNEMDEQKLKKTLKGYLLGFLTATLLFSGVVYAASSTKTIDVIYDNIKV